MEQPGQRKVLIAIDGSEVAEYAFNWYMNNMKMPNDYVYGVVVAECEIGSFAAFKSAATGDALQVCKKFGERLSEFEKLTADYTARLRSKQTKGQFDTYSDSKPGEVICKVADDHDVDVIVIGSRGLGKLKRAFIGSVSQYVIHNSYRPVTVVPRRD